MSEAALEEVSVLSSIYCGEGEFQLIQQSAQDGLVVLINSHVGGERGLSVLFHLPPLYPSCPPDVSVSSTSLSRSQCLHIRHKLLEQAAALPPEPMVHTLLAWLQQCEELTEECSRGEEGETEREEEEGEWTTVLLLDHIRCPSRYIAHVERWSHTLLLRGRLLLGPRILLLLQGARTHVKEFCRLLKTVKVDVDSSGKKCKERMMKVLIESPSSPSCGRVEGFVVKSNQSFSELSAAFQEINMTDLYQQILPSLSY